MGIQDLLKSETIEVTTDQLGELGQYAAKLVKKQKEIAAAEEALKALRTEERHIAQEEIPTLMDNLGMDKITLNSGHVIAVKESVHCSIPAAKKPEAFVWMDEHGHGDLIKAAVTAKFGRGDKDEAYNAVRALEALGVHPDLSETVHPGTLKAWARKELEAGRALPESIFNIHIARIAEVK